nr:hypothetical protein [uncultured Methanoregula sp.]
MKFTIPVLVLIIAAIFLAGCTTTPTAGQETARDIVRAHYGYNEDWSPGLGCYDRISGYAYNTGNATAENVVLNLNLVNTKTKTIRDSRSVFIGNLGAGQSVTFESVLDGECLQDYRVDAVLGK